MKFWYRIALFFLIVYAIGVIGNILPLTAADFYFHVTKLFFAFYFAGWILQLTKENIFTTEIGIGNKAVLITGCDTGFGHFLAKRLDKKGFKVFACCLDATSNGACELEDTCSNKLQLIQMDVTRDESVKIAMEIVAKSLEDQRLWAVVNNAGIYRGFQTELSLMKDYEDCMQVNTLGMIRVTKAFLPFLRRSKGRLVNICSISGRISCPLLSAYSVSKHAAVAYTEAIALELAEFGIRVISVEPEFFSTSLCSMEYLNKCFDSTLEKIPEEIKDDYGKKYIESAKKCVLSMFNNPCPRIEYVINAIEKAVTLQYPSDVYRPSRNLLAKLIFFAGERIPREIYDFSVFLMYHILGLQKAKTGEDYFTKLLNL